MVVAIPTVIKDIHATMLIKYFEIIMDIELAMTMNKALSTKKSISIDMHGIGEAGIIGNYT